MQKPQAVLMSDRSMSVHEMFVSWQGEGARAGVLSLFIRVSKCNLWTGRERDRATAVCQFCDTDFRGTGGTHGGVYSVHELLQKIHELCAGGADAEHEHAPIKNLIFTGGEPLLMLTSTYTKALRDAGYFIAVETNGTLAPPEGIDWLCVSPKAGAPLTATRGNELKVIWPQPDLDIEQLRALDFDYFMLQPMDVPGDAEATRENLQSTLEAARLHPEWRLSLQTHKWIGVR